MGKDAGCVCGCWEMGAYLTVLHHISYIIYIDMFFTIMGSSYMNNPCEKNRCGDWIMHHLHFKRKPKRCKWVSIFSLEQSLQERSRLNGLEKILAMAPPAHMPLKKQGSNFFFENPRWKFNPNRPYIIGNFPWSCRLGATCLATQPANAIATPHWCHQNLST